VLALTREGVYVENMMTSAHARGRFGESANISDSADVQRILVQALQDPARYPDAVGQVTLLETHISYVLLTGSLAYKIKKAVNFGFLDFSTLEKRRLFCDEELRLNRRLAPQLYLSVVPIQGTLSDPCIGGSSETKEGGAPIEYAVEMAKFPKAALLDGRLARGDLVAQEIDALTDSVARFHARVPSAPSGGEFGAPAAIRRMAAENFRQLLAEPGDVVDVARLKVLEFWIRNQYARLEAHLDERRRAGFVRECHGDLHLGNIALIDDKPVIFDCIEFNPQLRWIDVISEVAFLSMDLNERGRADFARRFINRYLEATGDYAGLRCLTFY